MAAPRVLLLALDSAEPTLIQRWTEQGRLPNLAKLMASGASTDLRSAAEEFPDEVWPSVYASANSAAFGKYYYIQPKRNSEGLELVDDSPKGEQFWVTLSNAGKRCAVIDPPKTALADHICGIQLANWGAHATRCDRASNPPELLGEIRRRIGDYPLHTCDNHGRKPREYRELRDQLIAGARRRGELLGYLLDREPWDLFFGAFSETHCAGHQFWHLQDPRHPLYDAADRDGLNSALFDVYAAVDEELGKLFERAGPDTSIIVFSGHGMAAQYHGRDLLPTLLRLWGMQGPSNIEPGEQETDIEIRRGLVATLKETIPIRAQYLVKSLLPKGLENAVICRVMGSRKLNPEARVNYVPNNDLNPAFRVNLKGRDPHGTVEPGAEYDAVCSFLEQRLKELINPATGGPAIRHTTRLRETHHGPYLDILPDVCAMWSHEAWIEEVRSPGYATVRGGHHDLRTGGHNTRGFLAMRTPQAAPDFGDPAPGAKDVAPTVLDLLGVDPPPDMEGHSLVRRTAGAEIA